MGVDGVPIPGADVSAMAPRSNSSSVRTDMNGHFRIDDLVKGTVVGLVPRVDGRGPNIIRGGFAVGSTDVILVFNPDVQDIVGPVQGRRGTGPGRAGN